ncbi:MAG: hypothetical protein ACREUN_05775 [Burkholderiales bacterium]
MKLMAAVVLALLAACAYADTVNVEKSMGVLDFRIPKRAPEGLDVDGDGQISRAEAAGHAEVTLGFDRADRNRNGRISTAEWARYEKWQERRAKARDSASAGGTRAKRPPRRSAP